MLEAYAEDIVDRAKPSNQSMLSELKINLRLYTIDEQSFLSYFGHIMRSGDERSLEGLIA